MVTVVTVTKTQKTQSKRTNYITNNKTRNILVMRLMEEEIIIGASLPPLKNIIQWKFKRTGRSGIAKPTQDVNFF